MAKFTCPHCGYVFWAKPAERCTMCGYHYDYIEHMSELTIQGMKHNNKTMIEIRTVLCDIREQDVQNEGLVAEFTVSNQGILLKLLYKYKQSIWSTKRWKYTGNNRIIINFDDILSIEQGTFHGKPVPFYAYETCNFGTIRPDFRADLNIRGKSPDIDREMRDLIEQFR